MSEEDPQPSGFLEAVTAWLQANGHEGATAASVWSWGTDWAGDTASGFRSEFNVNIRIVYADGTKGYVPVEGDNMKSLWDAVVRGYTAN